MRCVSGEQDQVRSERERKRERNGSVVSERRVQVRGAKSGRRAVLCEGKDCFDRMSGSRIRPTEGRRERCLIFLLAAFEATLLRAVLSLKTQGLRALTTLAVLNMELHSHFLKSFVGWFVVAVCSQYMMRRVVFVGRRNAGT